MRPILEAIAQSFHYTELPETWRVPGLEEFSERKTLYAYQQAALKNAARALYLYFGKDACDWIPGEDMGASSPPPNLARKRALSELYSQHISPGMDARFSVPMHATRKTAAMGLVNPVFSILSKAFPAGGDLVHYHNVINRMCFWMATGSGKTLVMVKLIEYLRALSVNKEIPPHNILILAPSEHLLAQIHRTVDEYNRSGETQIELVPLREHSRPRQGALGNSITVYHHRSDNISDKQGDALLDYARYENNGKWYILLDEAHKGVKEDSRRQAYYAVMAREGFLFNFSATFVEGEDIATTVFKHGLAEFVRSGHAKNIFLSNQEYDSFRQGRDDLTGSEKRRVVLKSLSTLALVSRCVKELRGLAKSSDLYHKPMMLTLVNSVNTEFRDGRNDLWVFFRVLREIASNDIPQAEFKEVQDELLQEWRDTPMLLGDEGEASGMGLLAREQSFRRISVRELRREVFLSETPGALQVILGEDNKEIALQLKTTDSPFALIRIGDTSGWRASLLGNMEVTDTLREKSFFDNIEKERITILLGSRAFFESWDSNRPNTINFINIGIGKSATKFVLQSIGRGVRIEPLPDRRQRLRNLVPTLQGSAEELRNLPPSHVAPVETLFLFATNRAVLKTVLDSVDEAKRGTFDAVEGFEKAERPRVGGTPMTLLVPEYGEIEGNATNRPKFAIGKRTLRNFRDYVRQTDDSVLAVRNGLRPKQIRDLRAMAEKEQGLAVTEFREYGNLSFLLRRMAEHLGRTQKVTEGVRTLDEERDIVHFREIRVDPSICPASMLSDWVREVAKSVTGARETEALLAEMRQKDIKLSDEMAKAISVRTEPKREIPEHGLKIQHIANHYYVPLVIAERDLPNFIQHVVKTRSEARFLAELEDWIARGGADGLWDAWMFSKIDETLDKITIPYPDPATNDYREFFPDFIFWMCRGRRHNIVFVDPKGVEHTSAMSRIDGYRNLFEANGAPRVFQHGDMEVTVRLAFHNREARTRPPKEYRKYWIDRVEKIFKDGPEDSGSPPNP